MLDLIFEIVGYFQVMSNLLYFYGMCGVLKEILLQRYFSKVTTASNVTFDALFLVIFLNCVYEHLYQEVRGDGQVPESDIVQACRSVSVQIFPPSSLVNVDAVTVNLMFR
uniref:Uncharacterized protein n=1 Tax=Nelumbo nucifera TaxID=4432 RepID=A0A822ZNF4_NELNU|nr:TPA_asm: hypothetical protein HUJ06_002696 [Nelumbo nucifera]